MKKIICKKKTRIDKFISNLYSEYSRFKIVKHIFSGNVKVNNKVIVNKNFIVAIGDCVEISKIIKSNNEKPWNHNINIIFEDDQLIIINKESNLTVHPGINTSNRTLLNAVLWYLKKKNQYAYIVNRIDKKTSGIVIFAKNEASKQFIQEQFKNRKVKKEYLAIVNGIITDEKIKINAPISKSIKNPLNQRIGGVNSKEAITKAVVIDRLEKRKLTLLKCFPITGRTHQIRIHFKYINYPIYNDEKYGIYVNEYGQYLHSWKITFLHPNKKLLNLKAQVPNEFMKIFVKINDYEAY